MRGLHIVWRIDGSISIPMFNGIIHDALEDVAKALGYEDPSHYNHACVVDPNDVQRRIDAL